MIITRRPVIITNRRLVAHHEAGHRVASYRLFPNRVRGRLTIVREGQSAGHAFEEETWECDRHALEAQVVVIYAGAAAELELAAWRRGEIAAHAEFDEAVAGKFLAVLGLEREPQLRGRAAELVIEHWREVRALARELLWRRTLTGRESELICDAAAGGPHAAEALHRLRGYRESRKATTARRWFLWRRTKR